MINWAELLVDVAISLLAGLLLDEIILKGKARKAVACGVEIVFSKSKTDD